MRLAAFALGIGLAAISISPIDPQGSPDDESAIKAVVQSESDAWNAGDANAFGAHYAENGSFTNIIGQQLYGKQPFIDQHAMIFRTIYKGSHNVLNVGKITFVRPDVAIVDIDGILSGALRFPPGIRPMPDGTIHVKLMEVMTKEKNGWQIAAFHNVVVTPVPQVPPQ